LIEIQNLESSEGCFAFGPTRNDKPNLAMRCGTVLDYCTVLYCTVPYLLKNHMWKKNLW
jgi:hypothetical protein